eukprot:Phypoly_transcript_04473.p1 GENE.Phypoly_transcript_04473~~Phypoly_transcript_04473.p1  ORF type:complete len:679 (+),score=131.25 Phypoly_transcript_04473:53-2089(+)
MERSPSGQLISTSPEEQRNGSIFRRMYNSLHRPKKGADPFVDVADRFEQEQIREQRKKDDQQRPDHAKLKHHHTITGAEKMESLKNDTTQIEWEPQTPDSSQLDLADTVSPQLANSSSESHISAASLSKSSKPFKRGHALTSSSVPMPTSRPSTAKNIIKRLSLKTDPVPPTSPISPSSSPPKTDNESPKTHDRGGPVPPKPSLPTFKEFRPEKKEKVDMEELRLNYAPTEPVPIKEKRSRRNSKRSSGNIEKLGIIASVSSRLPSTLLPGMQLQSSDEVRKAPLDRPRHPYIPKKEPPGSIFSGGLRSSSSGRYSPRKSSPSSVVPPDTRSKSAAIPITGIKTDNVLAASDSTSPRSSPRDSQLPRAHTESLAGVYGSSLHRQRSYNLSCSPPTPDSTATSPIRERPSSPSNSDQPEEIDGFSSIRRKPKTRNLKDTLTPASRSLLKSKAAEMKKIQQQVVTAKDLAAYTQNEGKLQIETMFDLPDENTSRSAPQRSLTTPYSPASPSSSPRGALSSSSSPANISLPSPDIPSARSQTTPMFPKSASFKTASSSASPSPITPASSPLTPISSPISPVFPLSSRSPSLSNSDNTSLSAEVPQPNIPIATPASAPYPKPPYMLANSNAKIPTLSRRPSESVDIGKHANSGTIKGSPTNSGRDSLTSPGRTSVLANATCT